MSGSGTTRGLHEEGGAAAGVPSGTTLALGSEEGGGPMLNGHPFGGTEGCDQVEGPTAEGERLATLAALGYLLQTAARVLAGHLGGPLTDDEAVRLRAAECFSTIEEVGPQYAALDERAACAEVARRLQEREAAREQAAPRECWDSDECQGGCGAGGEEGFAIIDEATGGPLVLDVGDSYDLHYDGERKQFVARKLDHPEHVEAARMAGEGCPHGD